MISGGICGISGELTLIVNKIEIVVDNIVTNAETVSDEIEDQTFGEYAVVKAALDYNSA